MHPHLATYHQNMNRNLRRNNIVEGLKLFGRMNKELRQHIKMLDVTSIKNGFQILGTFLARQTSPIFAFRMCRTYQILHLHSRLWTNHVVNNARNSTNAKRWFLGFVFVSLCDQKHVTDGDTSISGSVIMKKELDEHMNDLDYIHELTTATVICPNCKDRLVVDKRIPNIEYCHCPSSKPVYNRQLGDYPWVPFVETPDLLIWRKPHETKPGLYIYKVYGYYSDISAIDFLETQLDLNYRKKWDNSVRKLEIVESDEVNQVDIVHWEMQWPKMFSNRDYCFARRHIVNEKDGTMVIMNKGVEHPKVPVVNGVVRVTEYSSVMQIRGKNGLDKPGVEFGLTYYDNPGLSLPGWLLNWASMTAIPEFLNQIRNAARTRRKLDGKKIYYYTYNQTRDGNTGSSGDSSFQPRSTEILSQFFKENILESPLNEVEA